MMKRTTIVVAFFLLLISGHAGAQQPVLSVKMFEYIWHKDGISDKSKSQVIIAAEDSVKKYIEQHFARAIVQRWSIQPPVLDLLVKPRSAFGFSDLPKFNTKIKEKQNGTWYLFLQMYEAGNFRDYDRSDGSLATRLNVKCKVIRFDDSIILDRNLLVTLDKNRISPDQIELKRLPAYPSDFLRAVDSIATWIFQEENVNEKNLFLKPACVFSGTKFEEQHLSQLQFSSDDHQIDHLTEPKFSLHTPGPTYIKTKSHKNIGGNIASGAVTLLTGLSGNKLRWYEYNADFPFEISDSNAYHCIIHFFEAQTAEQKREKMETTDGSKAYTLNSGDYKLAARMIDSGFVSLITFGNDTLATFGITYLNPFNEQNSYTRMWDGSDSTTIINMPKEWQNINLKNDVIIRGQIERVPFTMRSVNEGKVKRFYMNDEIAIIIYGETNPVKALLYKTLTEQQIKLFAMLSSIPYSDFDYSTGY